MIAATQSRITRSYVLLILACALAGSANAGFIPQGKLSVGTNEFQQLGSSVALSADGNTAIVGAPNDSNDTGAAWVYTRSGNVWTIQGPKLVGKDNSGGIVTGAQQGYSVALSGDGNTALVGGPYDNGSAGTGGVGAAWVFTRSGTQWTQKQKLIGLSSSGKPQYGTSVALSADGNTAIVGAPNDSNGLGAAWVWTWSSTHNQWSGNPNPLVGTPATAKAGLGWSVALSSNGTTAIVGGPWDGGPDFNNVNADVGAAWVFTRSGTQWTQQGNKLVGTNTWQGAEQGTSVALSADGNTAIVGGPGDNDGLGAAWVFTRSGGVWTQQGPKVVANGSGMQGYSVALSGDGNRALVGGPIGPLGNGTGAAWAFTRSNGAWQPLGVTLVANNPNWWDVSEQGYSVALSGDGTTAIVGEPGDSTFAGAAWVYTFQPLIHFPWPVLHWPLPHPPPKPLPYPPLK